MLSLLPPRLHMFIRQIWYMTVAYLTTVGTIALYNGDAEPLHWWYVVAIVVGAALGSTVRQVPSDILAARFQSARSANGS